ncbi:DNA polymerase epsilon subunit B-like protein [Mitosporidium daphniae]|uniref:DNA polymerase epsilon subunit B-like protein n=1 Tax=Mitosporidium daphniae TaxID=1485682 RepID=A0A098VN84_9MICR|nr:DNA polymerase epsilon subunit B-like protein [Mitosporidium daphniae]KGG50513.1 DNA polymerase epsilon subunit B-like protein [Mitosporidium daphniae]|eukprot:XP_013236964.1 DNA polymerase epsilon subunit B-like protein [Mitosporidium daphniae]
MGILQIGNKGQLILEDLDSTLELKITELTGSIVLLSGQLSGTSLIVEEIDQPEGLQYSKMFDCFFNQRPSLSLANPWKNAEFFAYAPRSQKAPNGERVYIFSDVWFNDPAVITLVKQIGESIKFLFLSGTLPKNESVNSSLFIPQEFPAELQKRLSFENAIFSSNPTRYQGIANDGRVRISLKRQLLLFSLLYSACYVKNSLFPLPSTDPEFLKSIFHSISRQSILCHFPDNIQPSFYNRHSALSLCPEVDAVIISDTLLPSCVHSIDGTNFANCGSFSSTSTYLSYNADTNEIDIENLCL